jgi:LPS sulfotransferase NodH
LWRTGCLGAPLEYLNFEPAGPYGFASGSIDMQRRLWRSVLRRRCSPNGVFGLKAFAPQLEQLKGKNPALLDEVLATMLPQGGPRRIVYLRRRDRVAQTVSYARATLTGVWRKEQEGTGAPPANYSEDALESAERGIVHQETGWEQMFAELRIEPLTVWHEDALADAAAVARAVADYLGVSIDPVAAVAVPPIEKQSEGDSREWAERYARSRSTLSARGNGE